MGAEERVHPAPVTTRKAPENWTCSGSWGLSPSSGNSPHPQALSSSGFLLVPPPERQLFLATWKDIPNENEAQFQIRDCPLNAGEAPLTHHSSPARPSPTP